MQALAIAAAGMTAAANRLSASAERTAAWDAQAPANGKPEVDLVKEAVDQVSARTAFKANAAVIRTADQMTGALLDLKV